MLGDNLRALKSELIINSTSKGVELAILEEGKLVELHRDPGDTSYRVGDIYLGRVRKVMPNLNAGFIDVGYDRDAFLHHSDLGVQYKTQQKWTKLVMTGKMPVSDIEKFKLEPKIEKRGADEGLCEFFSTCFGAGRKRTHQFKRATSLSRDYPSREVSSARAFLGQSQSFFTH